MEVGSATRAFNDARYCGDRCGWWRRGAISVLCVVDGLGHGEEAETAARTAIDYVRHHPLRSLQDIFSGADRVLRSTRGVAMGMVVVDELHGNATFAGIGNIRILAYGSCTWLKKSDYGIVGGGYKKLSPESVRLQPGDLIILFTDGIEEKLDLSKYDSDLLNSAQQLAEQILHDWYIERDDAAVLVYKYEGHHDRTNHA